MRKFKVVSGVIINDKNEIFICERNHGALKGYFEFPGGKQENLETDEETLIREMKEELNTEVNVLSFLCENIIITSEKNITLKTYLCKVKSGKLNTNVHGKCLFVNLDKLLDYPLCENERKTTQYLLTHPTLLNY